MISLDEHYLKIQVYNGIIGNKTYQFSPKDSITDLRNTVCQTTQFLMYQNFHFQFQNKILSQFLQIGQILVSGSKINIVFNSFDQRSSKFHYNKIKNILENPSILTNRNYNYDQNINIGRKDNQISKTIISQNIQTFINSLKNQQLMDKKVYQNQYKFTQYLNFSGYNPVPYYRKLMGDYYYLVFKSPEQIDYHITAHSQGFFINQSNNSHFNSNNSSKYQKIYISLLQLMYSCSIKFKQLFKQCLNKIKTNQYQKFIVGPLLKKKNQWMKQKNKISILNSNNNVWKMNPLQRYIKKQQIFTIKDWNQMFQIQYLQPCQNIYQKIDRQKLKFKIYQQFVDHAKIGAYNIIQKYIQPINPNSPKKQQTFIFANIYFEYVQNSFQQKDLLNLMNNNNPQNQDIYKNYNKNSKLTNNYILNLQLIDNIQGIDLHVSHSVLIQYKGYKLRAQSFPSSLIYSKKKNQCISQQINRKNIINTNKNFSQHYKDFNISLLKLSDKLNITYQNVVKQHSTNHAKKIIINQKFKGYQGIDKRKYIFNLQYITIKDYNFLAINNDNYIYRPQLIQLYNQKYKCKILLNTLLGKSQFNHYQLYQNQKIINQQKKLKSIANFAKQNVTQIIINFLENDYKKYLADTKNIIEIMHKYGLNCRYLGIILKKVDQKKSPHLIVLLEKVIYVKCIKNIINSVLKNSSSINYRLIISNLLNCIFYPQKVNNSQYNLSNPILKTNKQQQQDNQNNGQIIKKKRKRNKQKQKDDNILSLILQDNLDMFLNIKPEQLTKLVNKIAKIKYNHTFYTPEAQNNNHNAFQLSIFKYSYGKISLLRDICINTGLILEKKNYFNSQINSNKSNIFLPQNIINFNIRATHTNPAKKQLQRLIAEGDHYLTQFLVQESIQSYNKAIQYILTTFGGNNQKLPIIHKKLSFIYFKIGDIQTALLFGTHSLQMFQQFFGYQHIQTIDNLALLGFYNCAQRNFKQSQQYFFKAIYYSHLSYSELYPEILSLWLNLSTVYEIQKQYTQAIMCLVQGLKICRKIFTQNHLNTSIFYSALSSLHYQIPDIHQCIKFKEKSLNILKNLLPDTDTRVKQSIQLLEHYKILQSSKKIKQIHQKQQRKINNSFLAANKNLMMGAKGKFQDYLMVRQSQDLWRRSKKNRMFI